MDDEWEACGAFCVKFYDDGKEDIVIVDDQIVQTKGSDGFAFCQTVTNELWPNIIEKAYAKKYGSYHFIEGGLVSNALADLTNGIAESFRREDNINMQK